MIEADKRKAIFLLHQEGMPLREIARRLHVSRNTVAVVIAQEANCPSWSALPSKKSIRNCSSASTSNVAAGSNACTKNWPKSKALK
jgi:orotate phosphoribosyltransferase-like protein